MYSMETNNKAIIFCAPSGAGKTTLTKAAMQQFSTLSFSVSATTRAPRGVEQNGKEYYFLTVSEFQTAVANNEFVEWEEVYTDVFYGTLKREVERIHGEGNVPVFDVDVKGAKRLKEYFGDRALLMFVDAPIDVITERLHARKTETEEKIQMRLARLPEEMTYKQYADVVITNIDLETAIQETGEKIETFLKK